MCNITATNVHHYEIFVCSVSFIVVLVVLDLPSRQKVRSWTVEYSSIWNFRLPYTLIVWGLWWYHEDVQKISRPDNRLLTVMMFELYCTWFPQIVTGGPLTDLFSVCKRVTREQLRFVSHERNLSLASIFSWAIEFLKPPSVSLGPYRCANQAPCVPQQQQMSVYTDARSWSTVRSQQAGHSSYLRSDPSAFVVPAMISAPVRSETTCTLPSVQGCLL